MDPGQISEIDWAPDPQINATTRRAFIGQHASRALVAALGASALGMSAEARKKRKRKRKRPPESPVPDAGCGQYACLVHGWGSAGSANGYFYQPHGIAVSSLTGDIYVCDTNNHRVQQFSADGKHIRSWGSRGSGPGQFDYPWNIAVRRNGDVAVTDLGNYRVQLFYEGTFLREWGGYGTEPGKFSGFPVGIAFGADDVTYVTAAGPDNHVHCFQGASSVFIRKFGGTDNGQRNLNEPHGIAVAVNGDVFVAEPGSHRVSRFRQSGQLQRQWGMKGTAPGQFDRPDGIAGAPDGTIYVTERGNNRVQRFDIEGNFLGAWGIFGSGSGELHEPSGVAVHDDRIYVTDMSNNRIQQFALSPPQPPAPPPTRRKKRKRKKKKKKRR